jgi:hypothetical protein
MFEWTGNLKDDCRCEWRGLYLHAEQMDRHYWWWAVTDSSGKQVISSNDTDTIFKKGSIAREAAENAAKHYLGKFSGQ